MAETFTNSSTKLTSTSATDLYQAPTSSGDVAVVLSCMVANVEGTNNTKVTETLTNSSKTVQSHLCKDLLVPAGATVEVVSNKVILTQSQKLRGTAEVANDLEVTVSSLEIT